MPAAIRRLIPRLMLNVIQYVEEQLYKLSRYQSLFTVLAVADNEIKI